ncbi:hypothetical protein DIPPA_04506 [Diplonema papillatum]|nr:hypothetical protein DIPPA_04506 [Diplonema papillatum]
MGMNGDTAEQALLAVLHCEASVRTAAERALEAEWARDSANASSSLMEVVHRRAQSNPSVATQAAAFLRRSVPLVFESWSHNAQARLVTQLAGFLAESTVTVSSRPVLLQVALLAGVLLREPYVELLSSDLREFVMSACGRCESPHAFPGTVLLLVELFSHEHPSPLAGSFTSEHGDSFASLALRMLQSSSNSVECEVAGDFLSAVLTSRLVSSSHAVFEYCVNGVLHSQNPETATLFLRALVDAIDLLPIELLCKILSKLSSESMGGLAERPAGCRFVMMSCTKRQDVIDVMNGAAGPEALVVLLCRISRSGATDDAANACFGLLLGSQDPSRRTTVSQFAARLAEVVTGGVAGDPSAGSQQLACHAMNTLSFFVENVESACGQSPDVYVTPALVEGVVELLPQYPSAELQEAAIDLLVSAIDFFNPALSLPFEKFARQAVLLLDAPHLVPGVVPCIQKIAAEMASDEAERTNAQVAPAMLAKPLRPEHLEAIAIFGKQSVAFAPPVFDALVTLGQQAANSASAGGGSLADVVALLVVTGSIVFVADQSYPSVTPAQAQAADALLSTVSALALRILSNAGAETVAQTAALSFVGDVVTSRGESPAVFPLVRGSVERALALLGAASETSVKTESRPAEEAALLLIGDAATGLSPESFRSLLNTSVQCVLSFANHPYTALAVAALQSTERLVRCQATGRESWVDAIGTTAASFDVRQCPVPVRSALGGVADGLVSSGLISAELKKQLSEAVKFAP